MRDDCEQTMAEYYMDYDDGPTNEPFWKCRDGRVVLVREMTDSHLLNTIRFLRRNVIAYQLADLRLMSRYIDQAPDGAAMACEMETDAIIEMDDDEYLSRKFPAFVAMLQEAIGRGL